MELGIKHPLTFDMQMKLMQQGNWKIANKLNFCLTHIVAPWDPKYSQEFGLVDLTQTCGFATWP
jgi:hypothetical protein